MTTAYPSIFPGLQFQLKRGDGASPEVFSLLAVATTKSFKSTSDTEDVNLVDAAAPTALPARFSTVRALVEDITFSGATDAENYKKLYDDQRTYVAHNYQLIVPGTGAQGGGIIALPALVSDLEMSSSDNGVVRFSCTLKGQGRSTYTLAS